DGALRYWPCAFTAEEANELFATLRHSLTWQSEEVVIFGERRRVPRLVAWYGEPEAVYTYSGVKHVPQPFTAELAAIRARIEALSGAQFNSALANLYRNGRDGMGWHADNEAELGRNPVIASVSLGATRRFTLRHRRRKALTQALDLEPGSLLVMEGETQHHWLHALPKTTRLVGERINLTYRDVKMGTDLFFGCAAPLGGADEK
ncbi:MAG: alpha-ketoglutarate-dependent dioxygenase AlkB family protein, partial [Steroidobacteraceae bacterium]